MSWLSDLFGGVKDFLGDDGIKLGADLLSTGAQLFNNYNNQSQLSNQWDAEFAYKQQRDLVNDAQFQDKLAADKAMAGAEAGAKVKAAAIMAAAENRKTLQDAYAQYNNQLGGQRDAQIRGFGQLGAAMSEPFLRRGR